MAMFVPALDSKQSVRAQVPTLFVFIMSPMDRGQQAIGALWQAASVQLQSTELHLHTLWKWSSGDLGILPTSRLEILCDFYFWL